MARRASSSTELVSPGPEKRYLQALNTIFAIFGWQQIKCRVLSGARIRPLRN
jgi:hypothetical protein